MFGGVVSPAPRVVGPSSARIVDTEVPAGVCIILLVAAFCPSHSLILL